MNLTVYLSSVKNILSNSYQLVPIGSFLFISSLVATKVFGFSLKMVTRTNRGYVPYIENTGDNKNLRKILTLQNQTSQWQVKSVGFRSTVDGNIDGCRLDL